jgi:hypothetical protein
METVTQSCYPVHNVSKRFEVKVRCVENFSKQILYDTNAFYGLDIEGDRVNVFVAFSLLFGEQLLAPVLHTQPVLPGQPMWEDWLITELVSMQVTSCFPFSSVSTLQCFVPLTWCVTTERPAGGATLLHTLRVQGARRWSHRDDHQSVPFGQRDSASSRHRDYLRRLPRRTATRLLLPSDAVPRHVRR